MWSARRIDGNIYMVMVNAIIGTGTINEIIVLLLLFIIIVCSTAIDSCCICAYICTIAILIGGGNAALSGIVVVGVYLIDHIITF